MTRSLSAKSGLKPRPIVLGADTQMPPKGAPHPLGRTKSAGLSDGLRRQARLLELAARGRHARLFNELRGRHSRLGSEKPRKVARTHGQPVGEGRDVDPFCRIGEYPGLEVSDIVADFRFGVEERTELGLSTRPAEEDHHHARDEHGNVSAKIFLDQCQRKIDA